jgi:transcriptional regulator NrdR family protein
MNCPECQADTRVVDVRPFKRSVLRRRRECVDCGERFWTYESREKPAVVRINKDAKRAAMQRYRARHPERYAEHNKRTVLRREARQEAERTGENLQVVRQRWGVQ